MPEETIVRYCAPTLAGLKPANLFTYVYREDEEDLVRSLREINARLRRYGLRMISLGQLKENGTKRKKCLIYLYRPHRLARELSDTQCRDILAQDGYTGACLGEDLCRLVSRCTDAQAVPHEIGLFLGYPAEDVRGFIEHKGADYKMSGCWKVYGDEQKARCQFDRFKKCTAVYCSRMAQGADMGSLIVPERA